jgi:hypothetical protein
MAEGVEGQINLRGRGGGRLMKSIILIFWTFRSFSSGENWTGQVDRCWKSAWRSAKIVETPQLMS